MLSTAILCVSTPLSRWTEWRKSPNAAGKRQSKSHPAISLVFTMYRWLPLAPECWECFELFWRGVSYVWTVLCFGWCVSPYVHHSLSDAVAEYLRSQDITTSAWLDDVWMSNFRTTRGLSPTGQQKAARKVTALALTVFYRNVYFRAFPKCSLEPTTDLVFLGVGCNTAQRRFYIPEDKLLKLEAILRKAIDSRI